MGVLNVNLHLSTVGYPIYCYAIARYLGEGEVNIFGDISKLYLYLRNNEYQTTSRSSLPELKLTLDRVSKAFGEEDLTRLFNNRRVEAVGWETFEHLEDVIKEFNSITDNYSGSGVGYCIVNCKIPKGSIIASNGKGKLLSNHLTILGQNTDVKLKLTL